MDKVFTAFTGSIPQHYDRYLGPLIFEPAARDLTARLRLKPGANVLELACGTGIVTRQLAGRLGPSDRLTATDLNQAMIDIAREKLRADARVSWQAVDATSLPFEDNAFDAIVCGFGIMFFPDRPSALRETRRVLRAGRQLLFNTWDRLSECPVFAAADAEIHACFPDDPPRFYEVPFGMSDAGAIERLVRDAGFADVAVERVRFAGAKLPALDIATGIIRGGPFVTEIGQRRGDVDLVIGRVARRLTAEFGEAPLAAPMSALVCVAG